MKKIASSKLPVIRSLLPFLAGKNKLYAPKLQKKSNEESFKSVYEGLLGYNDNNPLPKYE